MFNYAIGLTEFYEKEKNVNQTYLIPGFRNIM